MKELVLSLHGVGEPHHWVGSDELPYWISARSFTRMSIGTHGMEHRNWRILDAIALEEEIADARRKLEDVIQRPATTAAIPFGSYDRRVLNWLMRDSWERVYTSDRGKARSSAKLKPRETIVATMQDENRLRALSATPPFACSNAARVNLSLQTVTMTSM
jgi:hypothetical protein